MAIFENAEVLFPQRVGWEQLTGGGFITSSTQPPTANPNEIYVDILGADRNYIRTVLVSTAAPGRTVGEVGFVALNNGNAYVYWIETDPALGSGGSEGEATSDIIQLRRVAPDGTVGTQSALTSLTEFRGYSGIYAEALDNGDVVMAMTRSVVTGNIVDYQAIKLQFTAGTSGTLTNTNVASTTGARDVVTGLTELSGGGFAVAYDTWDTIDVTAPLTAGGVLTRTVSTTAHHVAVYSASGTLVSNALLSTEIGKQSTGSTVWALPDGGFARIASESSLASVPTDNPQNNVLREITYFNGTGAYLYIYDANGGLRSRINVPDEFEFRGTAVKITGERFGLDGVANPPIAVLGTSALSVATLADGSIVLFGVKQDGLTTDVTAYLYGPDLSLLTGPVVVPLPNGLNGAFGISQIDHLADGTITLPVYSPSTFAESIIGFDVVGIFVTPGRVAENSTTGTDVGQVVVLGKTPDQISSLTLGGADAGLFTLTADRHLKVAAGAQLDFEADPVKDIVLTLVTVDGQTRSSAVTISLNDVNEAPTDIKLGKSTFLISADNSIDFAPGQVLTSLTTIDPDVTDVDFTYTLTSNPGGLFSLSGDKLVVADALALNQLAGATHVDIAVKSVDALGLDVTRTLGIDFVTDPNPVAFNDTFKFDSETPVAPIIIDVFANDSSPSADLDRNSLVITSQPTFGTVVILPDQTIRYTPDAGGFRSTQFTYKFEDADDRPSNEAVVRITPKGAVPEPFTYTGPELIEQQNGGYAEAFGTFTIGRSDGIGDLVRVVNGTIRVFADRLQIMGGTTYSAIGPNGPGNELALPLFAGDFTLSTTGARGSVTDTLLGSADDVDLAGSEFLVSAIQLEPNAIDLGGTFSFPDDLGGSSFALTDVNGVTITQSGLGFASGIVRMPNLAFTIPGGLLSAKTSGVALTYNPAADSLKLQGTLELEDKYYKEWFAPYLSTTPVASAKFIKGFTGLKLDVGNIDAVPVNPNFLEYKAEQLTGRGSIVIPEIRLGQGYVIKDLTGTYIATDTQTGFGGAIKLGIPFAPLGGTILDPVFLEAGFEFITSPKFELNKLSLGVSDAAIAIPEVPGLFLTKASAAADGLASSNQLNTIVPNLKFEGSFGLGWGIPGLVSGLDAVLGVPGNSVSGYPANLDITGRLQISPTTGAMSLGGSGKFYMFSPSLVSVTFGTATGANLLDLPLVDFGNGTVNIAGAFSIGSIFTGTGSLKADLLRDTPFLVADATGSVNFPSTGLFSTLAGKSLIGENLKLIYHFDTDPGNDSLLFTANVGVGSGATAPTGVQIFFDGTVVLIRGGSALTAVGSWAVEPDEDWIVMSAQWDSAAVQPVEVIVTYRETEAGPILRTYTEAEFAAHGIEIVEELSGAFSRSVSVTAPTAGVWDVKVVNTAGLGTVKYDAFGSAPTASVDFTEIVRTVDPIPQIHIAGTLIDAPADALVDIYADTDGAGYDGTLVAGNLTAAELAAGIDWKLADAPAGTLSFYAEVRDTTHGLTRTAYSPNTIKGANVADLAVTMSRDPAAGEGATSANYTIHVTNSGADEAHALKLTLELAGNAFSIVSKPGDVADPTVAANVLTFAKSSLAPGASFDIVVESLGDNGGAAFNPLSVRVTHQGVDPDLSDNLADGLSALPSLSLPNLSIANAGASQQSEGDAGSTVFTFLVTRSGDTSLVSSVDYIVTSAEANDLDFVAGQRTGSVSFAIGETSKVISVAVAGDTTIEADEPFAVKLVNPVGTAISTSTAFASIITDDVPVAGTVSISDLSMMEGDAGTKLATFTLTRSGGTAAFSVNYATLNGTAAAGSDYIGTTGTATFAAGVDTASVTVTINGDTTLEVNETFALNLANATGGASIADGQAVATILNDDVEPVPVAGAVSVSDLSISEGDAGTKLATFTLTRSGGTAAFSVDYATLDGTAAAGSDYVGTTGTATFAAGVDTATVTVTINGDTTVEANETFALTLANATGGASIADGQAVATILNDDAEPVPVAGAVSVSDLSITEGDAGTKLATFTLTRSGGTAAFSVDYATLDGTAAAGSDYVGTTGTATFAAGVDTATVSVTINGDTTVEANETFALTLANATAGASIADGQAIATIVNDDQPVSVIIGTARSEVLHGSSGDDWLTPLSGSDIVKAGSGNDIIFATRNDGSDFYFGDSGSDTIDYSALTKRVDVKLDDVCGVGTGIGSGHQAGFDVLVSIENVVGSLAADRISGNRFDNIIEGNLGNDTLSGGGGSDTFVFRPGMGKDRISDFNAFQSSGGHDFIQLSGFGITAENFSQHVAITDVGRDTLVTIDGNPDQAIRLLGVGNATAVTVDDFLFM